MKPEEIKPTEIFQKTQFLDGKKTKRPLENTGGKLARAAELIKKSYPRNIEQKSAESSGETKIDEEFYKLAESLIGNTAYRNMSTEEEERTAFIESKVYLPPKEERDKLIEALRPLDIKLLKFLAKKGLKIIIVNSKNLPATWGNTQVSPGKYEPYGGNYNHKTNKFRIGNDNLTKELVIHEAGHSLDDFISNDKKAISMSDIKNTKLQKFFQNYLKRCEEAENDKSTEWSTYAKINGAGEYFAEAFSYYFASDEKKKILKEADLDMYNYIENQEYEQDAHSI